MPTYQYRCTDCGQEFERYQSFTDDPISICPLPPAGANGAASNGEPDACGGDVRKIFGNVGISFKGSGFYRNDSRTAKSQGSGQGSSDGSSDSKAGDSKASESPSGESKSGDSKASESGSQKSSDKNSSTSTSTEKSSAAKAASASG